MNMIREYARQFAWRDWSRALGLLPAMHGQTVFDLGCGNGDLAAELTKRGACVLGFDVNDQLLQSARSRQIPRAEFHQADLQALPDFGLEADGIWCSFTAAYFPDLRGVLDAWVKNLRPGAWVAITEVDNLFGHEPLTDQSKNLLTAYAKSSLDANRYDFHMGGKLRGYANSVGLTFKSELVLDDQEFSFQGPADPGVLEAWRSRFDRMTLLHDFCGAEFSFVLDDFLACLSKPDHRSLTKVRCCIAIK